MYFFFFQGQNYLSWNGLTGSVIQEKLHNLQVILLCSHVERSEALLLQTDINTHMQIQYQTNSSTQIHRWQYKQTDFSLESNTIYIQNHYCSNENIQLGRRKHINPIMYCALGQH